MPIRTPYPNIEPWFISVDPLKEAGVCRYCPGRPSVVVDGIYYVCVTHVANAAVEATEQHWPGYLVTAEAFEEPLPHMPPAAYVDLETGELS